MTASDDMRRAGRLTQCLTDGDYLGAQRLLGRLIEEGASVERVLLDVIAPAQAQMGALWQANCVSVADEHAASRICERLITVVCDAAVDRPSLGRPFVDRQPVDRQPVDGQPVDRPPGERPAAGRGPLVVACAEGEWHSLPAQLVAELLTLRGWQVSFLGANVPPVHLAGYLTVHRPVALLLSASLASRLPQVHRGVRASHDAGVPVIVGGAAFGPRGALAGSTGADGWAADARHAARLLEGGGAWAPPGPVVSQPDSAAYARIAENQWRLLDRTMKTLAVEAPHLRGHLATRMDDVIASVQYVVEHLAAAVFADDDQVFTTFVRWLVDYLIACGEPVAIVEVMLSGLADALRGEHRATQALRAGAEGLDSRTVTW